MPPSSSSALQGPAELGLLTFFTTWPARVALLCSFLVLTACTYHYLDTQTLEHFLLRLQTDPYGTLPTFIAVYVISVVVMFPCMIVQVISGAIYGFSGGLAVSWVATSIGQSIAFLLGRYFFRAYVKRNLNQHFPIFVTIDIAMRKEGWKLVCLLRLSPVLPYNVLNYAAALTPVSFVSYTLASAIATVPWTALYTYVGTLSTSVVDVARGKIRIRGKADEPFLGIPPALSAALMVGGIVYGYYLSKRAIDAVLKDASSEQAKQGLMNGNGVGSVTCADVVVC